MEKTSSKLRYIYIFVLFLIFVYAIYLRIARNLDLRPLWLDEAPIALTVIKNNIFNMLFNIEDSQKAPLMFWIGIKLSGICFGYKEIALRIVPLISSILSVFVFYIFSKKFIKNKISLLIANFLFAINYQLIYYSQELKQYSGDVLLFMVALLYFSYMADKPLDKKNLEYLIAVGIFLLLSSFPACFVLAAYLIYKLFHLNKEETKNILLYIFFISFISVIYYYSFLAQLYTNEILTHLNYWRMGFLNYHNSIFDVFKNAYYYNFIPSENYRLGLILFFAGFIMTAKEKNSINRILIISLFIAVAASFLGLYPLYKRIQIYLIPVFIIFILKVCDIKKIKQQYLLVLFSIILLNFAPILNLKYMEQINSKDVFEKWNGRETLKVIQDNFKDGDTLLVNYQSKSQYEYYSKYLNFNPENIIIYDFSNKTKDEFFDYLNNLENNKDYWFLNIITSFDNQERDYLIDWKSNTKNVITEYEYIIRRSYVVKIEKKC